MAESEESGLVFELGVAIVVLVFLGLVAVAGQGMPIWLTDLWLQLKEIIITGVQFFYATWWLWFFLIVLPIFRHMWLFWRQEVWKHEDLTWKTLEIVIPREILKGPRGMEQILQTIRENRNAAGDFEEWYKDGEVTRWLSLEITSFGGEIHMYIHCYSKQAHLVEAAFLSYYPDVELIEVEDYTKKFPHSVAELDANNYEMWATEMHLARHPMYPVRTYTDFESPDEETVFDPIAATLEILSKAKKRETVGIQYVCVPAEPRWSEEYEEEVEALRKKKDPGEFFSIKSHRQSDILEAVEKNVSKPAYETIVRFIYLSPNDIFYDSYARRGIISTFNQYAALDLNFFVQDFSISTRTKIWNFPHIFPVTRNKIRKQRILHDYIHRETAPESWVERLMKSHPFAWCHTKAFPLNVEVLATLFHPPQHYVLTAPHIRRSESRKAGPSAGLPIYGDETSLEKFQ